MRRSVTQRCTAALPWAAVPSPSATRDRRCGSSERRDADKRATERAFKGLSVAFLARKVPFEVVQHGGLHPPGLRTGWAPRLESVAVAPTYVSLREVVSKAHESKAKQ
jgi:hypothetical protein